MLNKPIDETIVLITGASCGIGLATVERLAKNGYRVIATARNPDSSSELLGIVNRYLCTVSLLQLDVLDSEANITEKLKSVNPDIVINNAGIGLVGVAESFGLEQIQRVIETNVLGVIKVTNAVLPGMRERNYGKIIMLSSIVGPLPDMRQCFYSGSKAMLERYAVQLANDLSTHGYNIQVANVNPGPVVTHFEISTPEGNRFDVQNNPYPQLERQIAAWRGLMKEGRPVSESANTILRVIQTETMNFWNPTEMRVKQSFAKVYHDITGNEFAKSPFVFTSEPVVEEMPAYEKFDCFSDQPLRPMTVFITGASSGIGLAAALRFSQLGYRVIATARHPERSIQLMQLQKQYSNLEVMQLDVNDSLENIQIKVTQVGHIDILLNNAGIGLLGPVEGSHIEQIRQLINTNVLGLVKVTFAVLPGMRMRNQGMILSISSIAGPIPSLRLGLYSGTKAMVEHFTAQLRNDLIEAGYDQIVVANIHPGPVVTSIENNCLIGNRFKDGTNPYFHTEDNIATWRKFARSGRPVAETIDTIVKLVRSQVCNFWNPTEARVAENFERIYNDPTGMTFSRGPIFSPSPGIALGKIGLGNRVTDYQADINENEDFRNTC